MKGFLGIKSTRHVITYKKRQNYSQRLRLSWVLDWESLQKKSRDPQSLLTKISPIGQFPQSRVTRVG